MSMGIGIIGGGQLGQMMIQAGISFGYQFTVLDPDPYAPAHRVCSQHLVTPFFEQESLGRLFDQSKWVTTEFEHIDCAAIESACEDHAEKFFPSTSIIQLIQDKGTQFEWLHQNGFPIPRFTIESDPCNTPLPPFPFVQKDRTGGYDGRGVRMIEDIQDILNRPSVFQTKLDIAAELSIIVVRDQYGSILTYAPSEIETHPLSNMLQRLISPARVDPRIANEAVECAKSLAHQLKMIGTMAVEFFITQNHELYINEIAPRPHNSGHHTIESATCSQFQQHIRAISNLPVQPFEEKPAVMINLLGDPSGVGPASIQGWEPYLRRPDVFFHWYGKRFTSPFRKMGHVTILCDSISESMNVSDEILKTVSVGV